MALKAKVRPFELRGNEKKKDFPNPLAIEVTGFGSVASIVENWKFLFLWS